MALILHYPLTDGNLKDISGNNNHLSYINNNSKLSLVDSGKIGRAWSRGTINDGSDTLRSTEKIHLTGDTTMAAWVYTTNAGTSANGVVTNHSHGSNTGLGITIKYVDANDFRISCNTGTGSARTYNTYYGTSNIKGRWAHLAVRFIKATNEITLWVDGVQEYKVTYAQSNVSDYIDIFNWSTSYHTNAAYRAAVIINDVRIYDHALTEKEFKELARAKVLHFKFNEGVGATNIRDYSGYGFDSVLPVGSTNEFVTDSRIGTSALKFNNGQAITTDKIFYDNTNQEWTVMAWFNITDTSIGNQQLNNFNIGNRLIHSGARPLLYANSGVNDHYVYGTALASSGVWRHITFRYRTEDRTCEIYINGVFDKATTNWAVGRVPSGFAASHTIGANYKGLLNDLRIYATALSPADIQEVYELAAEVDRDGTLYTGEFVSGGEDEITNKHIINYHNFSEVGITENVGTYTTLNGEAKDLSGNNNSLTPSNITYVDDGSGLAANFNGSSSYITLGETATIKSYSFWIKTTTFPSTSVVVYVNHSQSVGFGFYNSNYFILTSNGNSKRIATKGTYTANVWNHIVATYDGSTTPTLYINGVETTYSSNNYWTTTAGENQLGRRNSGNYFTGQIKNFKTFNRALTAAEVKLDYNTMFKNEVQISNSGIVYAKEFKEF